tara:strand:+ start:4623 stop:5105 length:483 start_codon:yes stop_codon:yes gene_type:complete
VNGSKFFYLNPPKQIEFILGMDVHNCSPKCFQRKVILGDRPAINVCDEIQKILSSRLREYVNPPKNNDSNLEKVMRAVRTNYEVKPFGSRTTGTDVEDSDYDFFVMMPHDAKVENGIEKNTFRVRKTTPLIVLEELHKKLETICDPIQRFKSKRIFQQLH